MVIDADYAKKYWRPQHQYQIDGSCPVCGCHETTENFREHQRWHDEVVRIYEPVPMPALAALYTEHGALVPLFESSPRTLRNRLDGIAKMFRCEVGLTLPPYDSNERDNGKSHRWLIASPDGRPIGGLGACWREPRWVWNWIWVIATERRRGHVLRCWTTLKELLPGVEPIPHSEPSARFFLDRDDVPDHIRQQARRALGQLKRDINTLDRLPDL
jgi:hypothetical protein